MDTLPQRGFSDPRQWGSPHPPPLTPRAVKLCGSKTKEKKREKDNRVIKKPRDHDLMLTV